MWFQFTAAAERALSYASGWADQNDCDELQAVPLLAGLLSQPECRAASLLSKLAIDMAMVCQHWPGLAQYAGKVSVRGCPPEEGRRRKPLSRDVELSLELARQRLAILPQPLEMATEHVLLGLADADHEVSLWLREQGLSPDRLAADIYDRCGYQGECIGEGPSDAPSDEDNSRRLTPGDGTCGAGVSPAQAGSVGVAPAQAGGTAAPQVLRILDAAGNRGREALRVVEDYVRFVLDDRHLTELCKQLRHDLTQALGRLSSEHRLAARETQFDVGVELTTAAEQNRGNVGQVLAANFARLQEALRTLEEFGKVADADMAAEFKQLRYRAYTAERAITIEGRSIERLARSKLYVLIDARQSIAALEVLAQSLVAAGVDVLQFRDKGLDDRQLIDRAKRLRDLTNGSGTLLVVNDRADVAALVRADGVHLGQDDLSVKDARTIVGPEMIIGVSTHSIEQARQAVLDGANYIGVGPTFPSGTKSFVEFPGVQLLRKVADEIRLPAFAIGGISPENVAEVMAAGITRIALSGAVVAAADPAQAAREFRELLAVSYHEAD